MRFLRALTPLLLLVNTSFGLVMLKASANPPALYNKDFSASFLLGDALRRGDDPYKPLRELAAASGKIDPASVIFDHPTPHTLAHGLLVAPLSLFSYRVAFALWCVFSALCLLGVSYLLLQWWNERRPGFGSTAFFTLLALGWWPLTYDLLQGQLNLQLLWLFLLAWLALRRGREVLAGALLGVTIALKFLAWPIVFFMLLQRRWRGVLAAGAVAGGFQLVSLALIGWAGVLHYYLKVGPAMAQLYNRFYFNLSLWSVGTRLFAGVGKTEKASNDLIAAPLFAAPQLARPCSLLVVLATLTIVLWLVWKARQVDTQFSLLLCLSVLVSPVAWQCYLAAALIPICIVFRRLQEAGFPTAPTARAVILLVLLSVPNLAWRALAEQFVIGQAPDGRDVVSFYAMWLNFLPTLLLLAWCWLVWRSDGILLRSASRAKTAEAQARQMLVGAAA